MNTDRELMELAAKAAGIEIVRWNNSGCVPMIALKMGDLTYDVKAWNPLVDDGDSRRLEVKLGMKVLPYPVFSVEKHSVIASRRQIAPPDDDENTYVGPEVLEPYGEDPCAATRLAVLRVAAEIGRNMP